MLLSGSSSTIDDTSFKSVTMYHDTKTTCFGAEGTSLYDGRKAYYDSKTTCFTVVVAMSFSTKALWLCS